MSEAVIITGGGSRIGRAITERFLDRPEQPVVHYHSDNEFIRGITDRGVTTVQADLSAEQPIRDFVQRILDLDFPDLRGIIHNASLYESTVEDPEQLPDQYREFFSIHMLAPYLLIDGLRDRLGQAEGRSDVVFFTDMYARRPKPEIDTYASTKAGLESLTLSLARKLAPQTKVNAIAPGPILFPEDADENYKEQVLEKTPLGEEGGSQPVVQTIEWMFANQFLTGSVVPLDGGRRLTD